MARSFLSTALAALTLTTLTLTTGCGGESTFKPTAQGAPYEIVVVADHGVWDGPAGDTLRGMFHRQFPHINRQETLFDMLRVLPGKFKNLIARHRNVLQVMVDPSATGPSLTVAHDAYAQPQIVLRATAPDEASLIQLISSSRDEIMLAFENAEKDRDVAAATGHTPEAIATLIKERFGFTMSTGPGYVVQKMEKESDDFLWLRYEMPTADQGIIIYTYPFSGVRDFDRENLLARRNEFVSRIPAEAPGSYMITVEEVNDVAYKKINGRPWAQMSGLWDVSGDFMGGPYRNFSTLDAANQRVIAIDFYVFSPDPRLSQRNYIKQLEHFIYTVDIPGQAPNWNGSEE
ncbi:MAG: DUF4837 family protein [Alistipes sp.]|jgi:hypothetical protein|nr:DUF4837 family protein [Alistipes sp.]